MGCKGCDIAAQAESVCEICSQLKTVNAENEQLQTELERHRWIPVSERLPDRKGIYLVLWHNNKNGNTQLRTCEEYIFEKKDDWNFTHWKPIEQCLRNKP